MKSSFHSLTSFFALFCNCQFWRLDSIQFQAHIPTGWRLELDSTLSTQFLFYIVEHFLITTLHRPHRKHSPNCYGGVFTDSLPSNGRHILAHTGSRRNMFTKSLPSDGYTRHNIFREVFHHIVDEGWPMEAGARNSGTVHRYFCMQTYWKWSFSE
jgi:hypothetical protein